MSRNQRILLVVAAVAVAVIAFVIANPGGDDENGDQAQTTATQTQTEVETDVETETEVETQTETTPEPPQVSVTRIQIQGGEVVGGPQSIEVARGERVRIIVASDAPDEIHLHGYDIEHEAAPGAPARFSLTADAEGVFEMESHTAEDAGLEPLVARLVVSPS
jgi:FtsP/CotA-like multicopper oxidase with cupredoxin domain